MKLLQVSGMEKQKDQGAAEVNVPNPPKSLGLWSRHKSIFKKQTDAQTAENSEEDELNKYLSEPGIPSDSSAGEVWKYWGDSPHQRLKQLVFKFLCVPSATVFSERLFSTAGNIVDKKRNRLDPDRVKMLVFLNRNLK